MKAGNREPGRQASPIYEPLRAAIRKSGEDKVNAAEIIEALGPRAFGMSILIIVAPVLLPMPPGVPTVVGVILSLFAIQLMLGFKTPFLPKSVKRLTITRQKLLDAVDELERRLLWIEKLVHPRWQVITCNIGARFIGAVFLVLGLIMILPIPFLGNLPPAVAAAILALALAQRDGVLAIIGLAAAVAAVALTWNLTLAALGVLSGFAS